MNIKNIWNHHLANIFARKVVKSACYLSNWSILWFPPSEGGFLIARNSCPAGKLLEKGDQWCGLLGWWPTLSHDDTSRPPPPNQKAEQSEQSFPKFGGIGIFSFFDKMYHPKKAGAGNIQISLKVRAVLKLDLCVSYCCFFGTCVCVVWSQQFMFVRTSMPMTQTCEYLGCCLGDSQATKVETLQ